MGVTAGTIGCGTSIVPGMGRVIQRGGVAGTHMVTGALWYITSPVVTLIRPYTIVETLGT